jgi:hypothetical protein
LPAFLQQKFSRCRPDAGALNLQDLFSLSSALDMHVLDFGTNAFYPHSLLQFSLDCSDEPFGAAPELVVETKPPEEDLDFGGPSHKAN